MFVVEQRWFVLATKDLSCALEYDEDFFSLDFLRKHRV